MQFVVRRPKVGSIPACAGEAGAFPGRPGEREVYPRVCGGSGAYPTTGKSLEGLSPRVRGKRVQLAGGQK